MITVSMLSTYLYCSRKLYLQNVLKLRETEREDSTIGAIRHTTYDVINKNEQEVVTNIQRKVPKEELHELYKEYYSEHLRNAIRVNKERLKVLGINSGEVFKRLWPLVLEESITRANNIYEFIETHLVFGEKLWELLTPKIVSEFKIISSKLDLIGTIDQVEHWQTGLVPVEIKTGNAPMDGIWPGHKIQLLAYAILLEDYYKKPVKEGFVIYLGSKEKRHLAINPFMKYELNGVIGEVRAILKSKELPDFTASKKKCEKCGLRDKCYNKEFMDNAMNNLIQLSQTI